MAPKSHRPLTTNQQTVAVELQGMLVDLLDLALLGKHAHWNVEGRNFRSVHHELDELVDAWRMLADDVAERAATIGASPDGQVETVAAATQMEPLGAGPLSDRQVVKAIGDRLAQASIRTHDRIAQIAESDPVTCDLLIGVAGTLQKQLWMTRAQSADAEGSVNGRFAFTAGGPNGAHRP